MFKNGFLCLVLLIGFSFCDEIKTTNDTANIPVFPGVKSDSQPSADNLNQKINEANNANPENEKGEVKLVAKQEEATKKTEVLRTVPDSEESEDGLSFMFILTPLSLLVIGAIVWRTMRLKKTRAEIKYGAGAERNELRPLPIADSDSDNEENNQTLFDINQLKNSRSSYA